MNSRTLLNLVLAFSLMGLIALAVFEPGKNETPTTNVLTQLNPEHIKHIYLKSPGHVDVDLTKIDGRWEMLSPFQVSANQERLSQLLKIVRAKSLATYDLNQVDSKQLQLEPPSLTLTLNDVDLHFGGTTPLGGNRYVQIDASIHLITDRYSHLARGPATDLVNPRLLSDDDNITALHLPAHKLSLHAGQWQLKNNTAGQSQNPDHIQQLLSEWRHARAFTIQQIDQRLQTTGTITVITNASTLHFALLQTKDELILQRPDLKLQYHFSQEAGQRLLNYPNAKSSP